MKGKKVEKDKNQNSLKYNYNFIHFQTSAI